jgi:hypothetical protein
MAKENKTSELDIALRRAIMFVGIDDRADECDYDKDFENSVKPCDGYDLWEEDFMDEYKLGDETFDEIRQIQGVTLNGSPVFEEDFIGGNEDANNS